MGRLQFDSSFALCWLRQCLRVKGFCVINNAVSEQSCRLNLWGGYIGRLRYFRIRDSDWWETRGIYMFLRRFALKKLLRAWKASEFQTKTSRRSTCSSKYQLIDLKLRETKPYPGGFLLLGMAKHHGKFMKCQDAFERQQWTSLAGMVSASGADPGLTWVWLECQSEFSCH